MCVSVRALPVCTALSHNSNVACSLSLSLLLLLCALITPERVVVVVRVVVAVRVVVPVHFVVIAAAVWFFFFGFGNVVERAPALRVAPSTSLLPSSSLSLSLLQLNCNEHVAATQPPLPLLLLLLLVLFDFYFVFGFFGKFVKFSSPTLRWLPLSLPPLLLSHTPSFSVSLVSPLLLASTLICLNCFLINYQRHFLFIVCQAIFFFFFTSFLSSLFWRLYSL